MARGMSVFERAAEKRLEKELLLDRAYKKAQEILQEDIVDPEEFVDLYGRENVEKDLDYVKEMEERFRKESTLEIERTKRMATVLEAIIYEQAELSEWLGPNACTIKPSRYDDIKNGVDSVVEFQKEEGEASHLALAIDVTFSPNIEKKLERIKREIRNGQLTRIKYFVSEYMGFRGELTRVPRVVIGADVTRIRELSDLWLNKRKRELADHPVQFQILEEMRMQLEFFKEYAREVGREEIALVYHRSLEMIKGIIASKQEEKGELPVEELERDQIFRSIQGYIRREKQLGGLK